MAKDPSYFMYFPGNYRWSWASVNMIGSAAYGGADFGELHKIGRLLKDKALHRVVFTEITPRAIKEAMGRPRQVSVDMVNEHQARRAPHPAGRVPDRRSLRAASISFWSSAMESGLLPLALARSAPGLRRLAA